MEENCEMCIELRVDKIRRELLDAAKERWGSAPQIIAVSKTFDPQTINQVLSAGIVKAY